MKKHFKSFTLLLIILFSIQLMEKGHAQNNDGCLADRFGIDGGLYSGIIEYGTAVEPVPPSIDWFEGGDGFGVITQSPGLVTQLTNLLQTQSNPTYIASQKIAIASIFEGKILIDALFARDEFGGTGHIDQTSFVQASKNGEDPAIWAPGPSNVLGKNDIIDLAGFMFREGTTLNDSLWFVGIFNMAEPGGTSYMDFEFFIESILYDEAQQQFTTGGPQLGHTAYNFDSNGNITKIGDFIFSVSLLSSGPFVETRLWVSRSDWENITPANFDWAGTFDGAFNGSPYGYAGIVSKPGSGTEFCGVINTGPSQAPPWGTKNTKSHVYGTTYQANSLAEVGINLTAFGMDHATLAGDDECFFPLNTFIVKTRASASFTAQLKDFAGPYNWASPSIAAFVEGEDLSCDNPTAEVVAFPQNDAIEYNWTTIDGNIVEQVAGEPWRIVVDKPGTYEVLASFLNECLSDLTASATVGYDLAKPFFNDPSITNVTTSCDGTNGSITLNVAGAVGPYTYTWEKDGAPYLTQPNIPPGNHTLSSLAPGTYDVTVKGLYTCEVYVDNITVIARTPVVYSPTLTHVTCFGFTDGKIELGTVTGNGPLSYLWSNGATSKDLLNIGAGTYTVEITDGDGCVTEDTFIINQPTQITATIDKTDDPGNAGNGSATVNASGGSPGYTYAWRKTPDPTVIGTDVTLSNIGYGEYTVTITDIAGCTRTFATFIFEKEICNDGIDNDGDGLTDCDDSDCIPDAPSPITPSDAFPCVGEEITYSVINDPDVDEYIWTVPANATLESGQGTNQIAVTWNTTAGGQICVRAKIFDCLSVPMCIDVDVDDVPPPTTNIQID